LGLAGLIFIVPGTAVSMFLVGSLGVMGRIAHWPFAYIRPAFLWLGCYPCSYCPSAQLQYANYINQGGVDNIHGVIAVDDYFRSCGCLHQQNRIGQLFRELTENDPERVETSEVGGLF